MKRRLQPSYDRIRNRQNSITLARRRARGMRGDCRGAGISLWELRAHRRIVGGDQISFTMGLTTHKNQMSDWLAIARAR